MLVSQILKHKGNDIWSVHPDDTILEALEVMADKNIGALLIMDGDEIAGIFSERDYARKVVLQGKASRETPVSDAMTENVICVSPTHTTDNCMSLMTEKRIRHLPVLEDDRVVGVISIGDVVKAVISEQASRIEHLENYITTGYG